MASTQEIESASTLLFDKLTLQEKALAKELVAFSNYDKATRIVRNQALMDSMFSAVMNFHRVVIVHQFCILMLSSPH
jgi:hypothetical protein